MMDCMEGQYGQDEETLDMINWEAEIVACEKDKKKVYTSKLMHGWLSTGHMMKHVTGSGQCTCCKCQGETKCT